MKKIISILLTIILASFMTVSVFADYDYKYYESIREIPDHRLLPRLVDDCDLLTDSEETKLEAKLDEISERHQVDVVVVTVYSLEGKSAMEFADDFYDYNGYGYGSDADGILLLVSMEYRDWWISTTGYGLTAFTDYGLSCMEDEFLPSLSNDNYDKSFKIFADLCDDYITEAKAGTPYDYGNEPRGRFPLFTTLVIALVASVIVAFIAVSIMKGQLKSVRYQPAASSYMKAGSLNLTESRDMFLYHNITRSARSSSSSGSGGGGGSSSHSSSSGRSHGGRGGKF